jgi:hypothetical protein
MKLKNWSRGWIEDEAAVLGTPFQLVIASSQIFRYSSSSTFVLFLAITVRLNHSLEIVGTGIQM